MPIQIAHRFQRRYDFIAKVKRSDSQTNIQQNRNYIDMITEIHPSLSHTHKQTKQNNAIANKILE